MKRFAGILLALSALLVSGAAHAVVVFGYDYSSPGPPMANEKALNVNSSGQITMTLLNGEDPTLGRLFGGPKGECRAFTADGVIKNSAGMLISLYITAAEVNDDFLIYDNASAASGTVVFNATNVAAGDKSYPNVPAAAANGLYLDVTAADASAAFTITACYL